MKRHMKHQAAAAMPVYKNPAAPATRRVKNLLSRMTLEEKAAQMMCLWQEKTTKLLDAAGNFDFKKARGAFKKGHGLGQVGRPSDAGSAPSDAGVGKNARETAELANATQKFFIKQRYASWDSGIGARIKSGKATLKEIEAHILKKGEVTSNLSGRQELLENLINEFI